MSPDRLGWPAPAFHFRVEIGGQELACSEVSGIEVIAEPGEPLRYGRITLRRGVFAGDTALWDWIADFARGAVEKRNAAIELLDAQRVPIRRWKLAGAWPARLSGPELSSTANAVAYESLEIAFDSMSVEAS